MNESIKRVAIVGGTHGNEFTGVYLVNKLSEFPELIQRDTFKTLILWANPEAFKIVKRYVDTDLNRCFLHQNLEDPTLTNYEQQRAKEINQQLGPKLNPQVDLICDLHSSTANMGLTLILNSYNSTVLQLFDYLTLLNPQIHVLSMVKSDGQESNHLSSITDASFAIEVGPVAQGVLNAELFLQTEQLIYQILDWIDAWNQGKAPRGSKKFTVYQFEESVDYPKNEKGDIQGMIHPQLQFKDYEALNPGDLIYLTFDGKTIVYEGESTVYPVFINEAAYYEKGIAMCLCQKEDISI